MTYHVIDFLPTGEVEAMHNDKFDLSFLGRQSIERATEIKFDQASQKWAIWFPKSWPHIGGGYFQVGSATGFATYEGARAVEVEWLNSCRLLGFRPISKHGLTELEAIRSAAKL
jgi:hypothetical protein